MKNLFYVILMFLFLSCDGFQTIEVLIIDSETNKPLEKVSLTEMDKKIIGYTDENGYFMLNRVHGFPFSNNDLTVIVSKENFISDTITLENQNQRFIKMEKVEGN